MKGDRILAVGTQRRDQEAQGFENNGRRSRRTLRHARIQRRSPALLMPVVLKSCRSNSSAPSRWREMKSAHSRSSRRLRNPDEWLLGRGWDQTKWTEQILPTRQDLDAVTADHPALLRTSRWPYRSRELSRAQTRRDRLATPRLLPEARSTSMHKASRPAFFARCGRRLSATKIPHPTPAQRRHGNRDSPCRKPREFGLTLQVNDNSEWADFLVYEELEREGKLTVRIDMWLPFDAPSPTLQQHRAHHPGTDRMLAHHHAEGLHGRFARFSAPPSCSSLSATIRTK